LSADKNVKESNARERPQSYQRRREEYHERKAAKSSALRGERVEKWKGNSDGGRSHGDDNKREEISNKTISCEDAPSEREGSNLKSDTVRSAAADVDEDKGSTSPSRSGENAADSETRDELAKDAKGRKVRYRVRELPWARGGWLVAAESMK